MTLPNELIMHIISLTPRQELIQYLFVCKYTFHLVRQRVYTKVIFPDCHDISADVISTFIELYGHSLETIKLPQHTSFDDTVYDTIFKSCPHLNYLQSNKYPQKQGKQHICFLSTHIPTIEQQEEEQENESISAVKFECCNSCFIFPNEVQEQEKSTLTHIAHYFHHPGALSNAILPTFGCDLLSLTLNPYDILTASVAKLIVTKCPKLRYLVVPSIKAEGLWMLLRWCHTLAVIIVGQDHDNPSWSLLENEEEEEDVIDEKRDIENERAVETIMQHKRVWCVHAMKNTCWHVGIIPKL